MVNVGTKDFTVIKSFLFFFPLLTRKGLKKKKKKEVIKKQTADIRLKQTHLYFERWKSR